MNAEQVFGIDLLLANDFRKSLSVIFLSFEFIFWVLCFEEIIVGTYELLVKSVALPYFTYELLVVAVHIL